MELGGDHRRGRARAARSTQIRAEIAADKEKALAAGGLYVIGTERHESRRIDNQLRGRSGRQGDPGASKFFLSPAGRSDAHLRLGAHGFASCTRLGLEPGEAITHPWVNKALEKAQQKVEARNFEIRKNILKYDNVLNDQRKVIFEQRRRSCRRTTSATRSPISARKWWKTLVARHIPEKAYAEQWDAAGLQEEVGKIFGVDLPVVDWTKEEGIADEEVRERIQKAVETRAAERTAEFRRRCHALCREGDPAADARSRLARAHRQSRPSAPVCRPARLSASAIR